MVLFIDIRDQKMVVDNRELFVRQLIPFLQDIEGRWKDFAIELEVSGSTIDNIKADCLGGTNNAECCREMFAVWQRSTKRDKRKWYMIKKAARTLRMENLIKLLEESNIHGTDCEQLIILIVYFLNVYNFKLINCCTFKIPMHIPMK